MLKENNIQTSQNQSWGFYGAIVNFLERMDAFESGELTVEDIWEKAFTQIDQTTNLCPETIRVFLDSRYGRHFADDCFDLNPTQKVTGELMDHAISEAIQQWMKWRISERHHQSSGIPQGLPYLISVAEDAMINHEFETA